jgi:hypothetical protein
MFSKALIQAAEMVGSNGVTEPLACVTRVLRSIGWVYEALLVSLFRMRAVDPDPVQRGYIQLRNGGDESHVTRSSPSSAPAPNVLAGKAPEGG